MMAHPIKMSTAKLEIKQGTAELTMNLFWDDFSAHLMKTYRNQIKPEDNDKLSRKIISDYLHRYIKISANGKEIPVMVKSFEITEENVLQVRFSNFSLENTTLIEVEYSVLMDGFDKQSNILHVLYSGERKSLQFTQRSKIQSFEF